MRYAEKWGDSIEAAVALALQDLGLTEDKVNVTVLEQPSKGFFGIGSKLAKVRVEEKEAEKPVKAEAPAKSEVKEEVKKTADAAIKFDKADKIVKPHKEKHKAKAEDTKKTQDTKKKKEKKVRERSAELDELNERPADLVENPDHPAQKFLSEMFTEMQLNVNVKTFTNANTVFVDVDGPDSGSVIGKRGATLDAIQYLTSLVVNKDENSYIRVVINAEGYRERREVTLEKLANRLADKAVKNGKPVRLEPMNPYERKVIHTALQARPEVNTRSEGEEPYRKVVIVPARK